MNKAKIKEVPVCLILLSDNSYICINKYKASLSGIFPLSCSIVHVDAIKKAYTYSQAGTPTQKCGQGKTFFQDDYTVVIVTR
ncbi:hypothetical protein KSF_020250 [Reticulibacter mediterranei]|uniref:Uncharacterized protein n=1 Tax=Reticulibacter mediterranei TaxID=2778369 RepID=A0A8J3IIC0_9CHLR|nr:hypothetical protein [Reticulibacter mediterranei]GHO91977.1 hypothetical protein KSF_020250 [Reticulibacter mediterranei]